MRGKRMIGGRPPGASTGFVPSRARGLDSQQGLEAVRRSAAEGGQAAQGGRHRRRPQARGDRQRLVQITPALGGRNPDDGSRPERRGRMGPWECGQSKPGPPHGRKRRKGLSTFPRPEPKESYMKKPRRAVAEWKAPNRPPTAESVGSVVNPGPEPETRTQRK